MNIISRLGNQILKAQTSLGICNPGNFLDGIGWSEQMGNPLLGEVFRNTELNDLYGWKNGVTSDPATAMINLWLKPRFFLLSIGDVQSERDYFVSNLESWTSNWYPLLSEGTADRLFVDRACVHGGNVPVFYAFWESAKQVGRIYDSIEAMLKTTLQCYQKKIYFLDQDGALNSHFQQEVDIARAANPNSDYWQRNDLFSEAIQ